MSVFSPFIKSFFLSNCSHHSTPEHPRVSTPKCTAVAFAAIWHPVRVCICFERCSSEFKSTLYQNSHTSQLKKKKKYTHTQEMTSQWGHEDKYGIYFTHKRLLDSLVLSIWMNKIFLTSRHLKFVTCKFQYIDKAEPLSPSPWTDIKNWGTFFFFPELRITFIILLNTVLWAANFHHQNGTGDSYLVSIIDTKLVFRIW